MANGRPASTGHRAGGEPCRAIGPSELPVVAPLVRATTGDGERRKVHLAMDTATADIRAVEFTPSRDGDSPGLPDLLSQIPADEQIGTVTADGAYDTRRCHTAIVNRQGTPIIPIRRNGRLWKEDCPAARTRNDTLRATRYHGRAFWKRRTGYHARSRIEAKMRCLKAFGERIMAVRRRRWSLGPVARPPATRSDQWRVNGSPPTDRPQKSTSALPS